ncbi:MAG: CRISPR-associated protein Cas5 [Firmicutes bacterium]|nr:CRISPR-associated protein Cas5 [Bacillota bacterium]
MDILVFDVKGPLAHFRRPDTTSTHASYPFMTRTALRGLLGAILGIGDWPTEAWTGMSLLSPVQLRVQQLSLLGKGFLKSGDVLNRPTTVELVINPHYRIYYNGPLMDELEDWLVAGRSFYPTYLGSAFALTFPQWVGRYQVQEWSAGGWTPRPLISVVPAHAVASLAMEDGASYARAGGMVYEALGGRRFRGIIHMIYESQLRPFRARIMPTAVPPVRFVLAPNEVGMIALW